MLTTRRGKEGGKGTDKRHEGMEDKRQKRRKHNVIKRKRSRKRMRANGREKRKAIGQESKLVIKKMEYRRKGISSNTFVKKTNT